MGLPKLIVEAVGMGYLELTGRCLLGLVFLAAVVGKLRNRSAIDEFADSIVQFGVLPATWTRPAARLVLGAEGVIVLLLAVPGTMPVGYLLAIGLLGVLTGAMLVAVRRGRRPACLCFGTAGTPIGGRHVARNILLMAVAVGGLLVTVLNDPPTGIGEVLLAAATAVPLAAIVVRLDDIVDLFAPTSASPTTPSRT
ncbi:methylamine utilization protein MauE [Micromonospora polyrhachis]|uniref:Putative membrane protein YphA (DoxX/SURF4 family) n=1 Tax=Micromonospora polyrhachis TaxID=1282883 RepID=A0A7W7SVK3_9ACTN|nr:MauE/DoxX family redox-associated membrane protein [Micromonospora polyrhachis]MBB4961753.1 putative membrane protein YphA (DoxX/SURF4 family) [Micromonospora polyrhachis]